MTSYSLGLTSWRTPEGVGTISSWGRALGFAGWTEKSCPVILTPMQVKTSVVMSCRVFCHGIYSVRGNTVFGRYYVVFHAWTPFLKLRRVPWTQFYCGQYSGFKARFSRFQCSNPFCVYECYIDSNSIANAQFETPCARSMIR